MGEKLSVRASNQRSEAKAGTSFSSPKAGEVTPVQSLNSPIEEILYLQGVVGNWAVRDLLAGGILQAKLKIGHPNDIYEQEADRVADQVMRIPEPAQSSKNGHSLLVQRQPELDKEEKGKVLMQEKSFPNKSQPITAGFQNHIQFLKGSGQPLPEYIRTYFEPRFGVNFRNVRVHQDIPASLSARMVNAKAYTVGQNVIFGSGHYSPDTTEGRRLLAHELTHVVQQGGTSSMLVKSAKISPRIQRRLVTFGTLADVNALLGLLGPQAGLTLAMNVANNQVQIIAILPGAPPSATLRARLTTIINHATQHAEVIIARGQPQVFVGAFPQPSDLTVTRVQQIDIDDILAIEAGAPGNGTAFAMHEIEENFQAHAFVPVAGRDRFRPSHQRAINVAENPVAAQLVGPGRRVAVVAVPGTIVPSFNFFGIPIPGFINPAANTTATFFDYENYYLGISSRFVAATQDNQIINSRRFPKRLISARTIDNFVSGSNATPAAGAAIIAAAVADVAANPTATVTIQGFTDSVGSPASNLTLSQRRVDRIRTTMQAAGVNNVRIHAEGLGETSFVAGNATAADRARNRRVVITVSVPQL